jgi:hypothetical protein
MRRWLTHPALMEMYPGLIVFAALMVGYLEGWGK